MKKQLRIYNKIKSNNYDLIIDKIESEGLHGWKLVSVITDFIPRININTTETIYKATTVLDIKSVLEVLDMYININQPINTVKVINVGKVIQPSYELNHALSAELRIDSLDNINNTYSNIININDNYFTFIVLGNDYDSKYIKLDPDDVMKTLTKHFDLTHYRVKVSNVDIVNNVITLCFGLDNLTINRLPSDVVNILRNVNIKLTSIVNKEDIGF